MQRKRQYDPEKTLLDDAGRPVPRRVGAVEWARDAITAGNTSVVAAAMAIALRIDDTLVCWPRVKTLAADIRSSPATIHRASATLQEQGVIGVLHLWRGSEPSGCLWVMNVDGWIDDVLDDRTALLRRVATVRERGFRLQMPIHALPAGVELSARKPANQHTSGKAVGSPRAPQAPANTVGALFVLFKVLSW